MHEDTKLNAKGLSIWVICASFYTYELMLRTVFGTFQGPISQELTLTPVTFAIMSTTCYFLVYSFMQIPVGAIAGKFGLKKSLTFAVGLCSIASLLFAYVHGYKVAILVRMLMGLGSAFGFVCLLIAVYDWMPKKNYGLFIGLSQFIGTIGPMFAAGPLNSIILQTQLNWRVVIFGLGIVGILIAILVVTFVQNNNDKSAKFRIITKQEHIGKNMFQLLRQHQTWLIALYSALVYFALEYLAENEGKAFIEHNGFSSNFSSYMITVAWLGFAVGCPMLGWLSDIFKRRKLVMIIAAASSLLSMIAIVYLPLPKTLLTVCFIMLGFGAGGQSIGFAIMAEQCNRAYLALGLGFNNALMTLVISINAPIVGFLLSYNSDSAALQLADYRFAFTFIIILISTALILATFFIKETYCRSTKGFTMIKWIRKAPVLANTNQANLITENES